MNEMSMARAGPVALFLLTWVFAACTPSPTPTPGPATRLAEAVAVVETATARAAVSAPSPTPAATLTRVATPTLAPATGPAAARTPTPARTPAPVQTGAPTPTKASAVIPAPALTPGVAPSTATLNLRQARESLWSQASFRLSVDVPDAGSADSGRPQRVEVTWVREPDSRHVRVSRQGAVLAHWIKIGTREWFGLGTKPDLWLRKEDLSGAARETTVKVFDSAWNVLLASLLASLPDQEARLGRPKASVDGRPCDEYTWSDGKQTGHVCIAKDGGLPAKAEVGQVAVNLSHVNDPANAIRPPIPEPSDRLHADDARMALNGLSSFRWTSSARATRADSSATEMYFSGTYVLSGQAWQALYWGNAEGSGPPAMRFTAIGRESWLAVGGEGEQWVLAITREMEEAVANSGPFRWWRQVAGRFGQGTLVAPKARSVDGVWCDEYAFKSEWRNDRGEPVKGEMRLFVVPTGRLPMRLELSMGSGLTTLRVAEELSRVDDPANVVQRPGRR